jgi:hypothetical protein
MGRRGINWFDTKELRSKWRGPIVSFFGGILVCMVCELAIALNGDQLLPFKSVVCCRMELWNSTFNPVICRDAFPNFVILSFLLLHTWKLDSVARSITHVMLLHPSRTLSLHGCVLQSLQFEIMYKLKNIRLLFERRWSTKGKDRKYRKSATRAQYQ